MNEPVAYINVEERKLEWATPIKWETPTVVKMDKVPLYTAPQTQTEPKPVAYLSKSKKNYVVVGQVNWNVGTDDWIPLYTAPPQHESAPTKLMIVPALLEHAGYVKKKEWVGLTEKETIDLALNAFALPEVSLEQRLHLQFELVKAMNEPDSRLMIFAATIEDKLKEKNGF